MWFDRSLLCLGRRNRTLLGTPRVGKLAAAPVELFSVLLRIFLSWLRESLFSFILKPLKLENDYIFKTVNNVKISFETFLKGTP